MTRYDFAGLEAEHYSAMYDRYYSTSEYEDETEKAFHIYWHNSEFEDIETVEADNPEEAAEKAEEILPEDAVIDSVKVA